MKILRKNLNRIIIMLLFLTVVAAASSLSVKITQGASMGYLKSWKLVGTSGGALLRIGGAGGGTKLVVTPGGKAVDDTSNNLTIGGAATIYFTGVDVTNQTGLVARWRWTLGPTFPDLSGYGHTAFPSYRITGTTTNVTASIKAQQAAQAGSTPPPAGSQAWEMISGNESTQLQQVPQGLYSEGGTSFPSSSIPKQAAAATKLPVAFFLYVIAFGTSIFAGIWVMNKTHSPEKGIKGSLLLQAIVSLLVMIFWVFIGGGVITGWSLIPFGIEIIIVLIFRNPYNPITS